MARWIDKVGLAAVYDNRLLVVRKRGTDIFILPGGKPERGESDLQTLRRELEEELGCTMEQPTLCGVFKDRAAGPAGAYVVVRLYAARLVGEPAPHSEIEELDWADLAGTWGRPLAPSIQNHILPYLRRRARASARSDQTIASEVLQGVFEVV